MSIRRYSTYKESEVDWFDELPDHWSMPPLYARYEQVLGKMLDQNKMTGEHPMPYVRNVDVQWGEVNAENLPVMDIEPSERERFTVSNGDLLICEGGEVGRTAIWNGECGNVAFQKAIHRLRPLDGTEDVRYFYHLMRFATGMRVFLANSNPNTIPHLTGEQLRGYRLPKPPLDEQEVISAFLDAETAKIDALVSEQRRLIELLKEKRQAVISHAVTKGLNPEAPMKPSGIQWLGDVPQHWSVVPVRRVIDEIEQGWSPQCDSRPADAHEWGILKTGCVNRGVFSEIENKALPEDLEPIVEYEVKQGDVLMSRASGSSDLVGATAFVYDVRPQLMLSDKTFRLHLADTMESEFFVAVFNSKLMRAQIEQSISGAEGLANNLPQSKLKCFALALPPITEQVEIVRELASRCQRFSQLQAEAERAIELLQERRTALISAAVTGKIDVRGTVPQAKLHCES